MNDLVLALNKRNWEVIVACYKPLARDIKIPFVEKKSKKLLIYRMPWVGFNLVHLLTPYPVLEFLYLFPGLFLVNLYALIKHPEINVIHSQGLVPGVVGIVLGRIFNKRVIVSTHNLYFFPQNGYYKTFSAWILSFADTILTLSNQSKDEIARIGVPKEMIKPFRYWLNLKTFKPKDKIIARGKLGLNESFIVFFVGRLIETKGVKILMQVSKNLKNVTFIFAGLGPLQEDLNKLSAKQKNLKYVGLLFPEKVRLYMSASDVVAVPSTVDEGYGRVAMEALACGTPVFAANKGGLNEVVTKDVGLLVNPNPKDYNNAVKFALTNRKILSNLAKNTRRYALRYFGEKNVEKIIDSYEGK